MNRRDFGIILSAVLASVGVYRYKTNIATPDPIVFIAKDKSEYPVTAFVETDTKRVYTLQVPNGVSIVGYIYDNKYVAVTPKVANLVSNSITVSVDKP